MHFYENLMIYYYVYRGVQKHWNNCGHLFLKQSLKISSFVTDVQ